MSEYTPDTEEIREQVAWQYDAGSHLEATAHAAFDRWLADHDREVAAKALTEFADAVRMPFIVYLDGHEGGVTVGDLLRAHAATLREATS